MNRKETMLLEDYLDDCIDRINELSRFIAKPTKAYFPVCLYSEGKYVEKHKRSMNRKDFAAISKKMAKRSEK